MAELLLTPQEPTEGLLRDGRRRAVITMNDTYKPTGDAKEHGSLDPQHAALTLIQGGLVPRGSDELVESVVKRSEKARILDLGTGSGDWAIAMAAKYPEADVLGVDLVPVNPGSEPPSNCRFEVCDANVDLDRFPSGSFDVVHARMVLQGINDFGALFSGIARILRPEGVFVLVEGRWAVLDENKQPIMADNLGDPGFTWMHKFMNSLRIATIARNPSFATSEDVKDMVAEMGSQTWEYIDSCSAYIPIGDWPGNDLERQAGSLMRQSVLRALTTTRPLLLLYGHGAEELDQLAAALREELAENKHHQYLASINLWAVKAKGVDEGPSYQKAE